MRRCFYFFLSLYLGGVNELKENVKGLLLHSLFLRWAVALGKPNIGRLSVMLPLLTIAC